MRILTVVLLALAAWVAIWILGCRLWDRVMLCRARRPLRRDIAAWERLADNDRRGIASDG
jgi:hypothetical protein